jgi:EAL domain-containing protein (putative c-di-GMP-specific phosphodiesterase class I)
MGVLGPHRFIPYASPEGLTALLKRALFDALRCADVLRTSGKSYPFSINIACRSLERATLLDELCALREKRLPDASIILEVTETDLLQNKSAAAAFATRAFLHNFQVSIDDFGEGYATFDRLRGMPFHELKLERSMVDGCAQDQSLHNICRAAVQLAHGFGAKAVAEGIERLDDLTTVRSLGFDMAQGYIFSRPAPFEEFRRLPETLLKPLPGGQPKLSSRHTRSGSAQRVPPRGGSVKKTGAKAPRAPPPI